MARGCLVRQGWHLDHKWIPVAINNDSQPMRWNCEVTLCANSRGSVDVTLIILESIAVQI